MKDYYQLLEEAYEKLNKRGKLIEKGEGSIEIPLPRVNYHGKFTYIVNIKEILDILRRDIKLFIKFLQKELNVACKVEDSMVVIQKNVSIDMVKSKVDKFIDNFVKCPVCKKLDTILIKKDRMLFIKCEVCGAESPVLYKL